MPYGEVTATIQSVDTTVSPLDDKPYWLEVRKHLKVRDTGIWATVGDGIRDWIAKGGKPEDCPEQIGIAMAAVIKDWNLEDDSQQKLAITAETCRGLIQEDIAAVDALYKPAVKAGAEAVSFTPPSVPGPETEGQPQPPASESSLSA